MQRPEYDRALEGVLESKRILLPANRLVEIDRMLRFAAELKQPTILYGVREAYRPEAADLLKKTGTAGAGEHEVAGGAARRESRRRGQPPHAGDSRQGGLRPGGAEEGRREVRAVLRRPGPAARPAARREEGDRRGSFARRRDSRADAVARRNLRRAGPRGQHRERQDRQPGGDARRYLRRSHQGGNDLRGWPQVHAGARMLAVPGGRGRQPTIRRESRRRIDDQNITRSTDCVSRPSARRPS